MSPLRTARFVLLIAGAVVTDLRAMARREVLRRIDHLLCGAPCKCCWQDDCWAEPSAKQETDQ